MTLNITDNQKSHHSQSIETPQTIKRDTTDNQKRHHRHSKETPQANVAQHDEIITDCTVKVNTTSSGQEIGLREEKWRKTNRGTDGERKEMGGEGDRRR